MKSCKYIITAVCILASSLSAGTVLKEDQMKVRQEYKEYHLAAGDTVAADMHVKVFMGDAVIEGVVNGVVTVYAGNAHVEKGAEVNGQVRSLGGDVHTVEAPAGEGKIFSSNLRGISAKDLILNPGSIDIKFGSKPAVKRSYSPFGSPDPLPQYEPSAGVNTQQGFYIYYGDQLNDLGNLEHTTVGFRIGYGFSSKEVEGAAQLRVQLFEKNPLYLYGMGYHEAHSQDWQNLPDLENALSYIFWKQDYLNRYMAEGYRAGGVMRLGKHLRLKAEYFSQKEDTMEVFHHNSLTNPLSSFTVEPGRNTGYRASAILNLGSNGMDLPGALQLTALHERSDSKYGGDWDFNRTRLSMSYIGTIRKAIQYRARVVSAALMDETDSVDTHPEHYQLFLGGMGTLRGVTYKSLQGQRSLLINQELGFGIDTDLWVLAFIDMGTAESLISGASLPKQLTDFDTGNMTSSIGFAVETGSTDEFGVRLDVAKDMGAGDAPWIWSFRMTRTF